MEEIVLQERKTLDEVLIAAMQTFRNGCNWKLVKELDGKYYIEYGCYGVMINLVTGDEKLLYKWFVKGHPVKENLKPTMKLLTGKVRPETINELLKKHPCDRCGGVKFREKIE